MPSCLLARRWQLTNTRYLLGPAGFLEPLNAQLDPVLHRFRVVQRFDVVPKSAVANPTRLEELTAELSTNGQYAVFEFTGALPRASLYAHWQVSTNLSATLEKLASPSFDPTQTVLVDSPIAAAVPATRTNQPAGTVEFARYTPAAFTLKARAEVPSVLLVNDKYDLDWKAFVDGRPAALMRANYIMRGVMVPAGSHTVEFRFRPSIGALYVTISAYAVGVLFLAALLWQMRVRHPEASVPKPAK